MPVAIAAGEAPVQLDDSVDRLGAAVVRAPGREIREERSPPPAQGATEAGDLRDRAGVECLGDSLRDSAALGEILRVVGGSQLLRALPRNEHGSSRFVVMGSVASLT